MISVLQLRQLQLMAFIMEAARAVVVLMLVLKVRAMQNFGICGDPQGYIAPAREALTTCCCAHVLRVCCLHMRWCRYEILVVSQR